MKVCTKCKIIKPCGMFTKDKTHKSGLSSQCKECRAEYRSANIEKIVVTNRRWRERHKDFIARRTRLYNLKYPNKARVKTAKHRALKSNATIGYMPNDPLQELIKIYGPECIVPDCHRLATATDHVIALANGGPHSFDNLQPMCKPCNSGKRDRNSVDYRLLCYNQ